MCCGMCPGEEDDPEREFWEQGPERGEIEMYQIWLTDLERRYDHELRS